MHKTSSSLEQQKILAQDKPSYLSWSSEPPLGENFRDWTKARRAKYTVFKMALYADTYTITLTDATRKLPNLQKSKFLTEIVHIHFI